MAYSDWGAFVHKDGERRRNREDTGVFDEDEGDLPSGARIYANLLKNMKREGEQVPFWKHSHHAVLGDGPVRLVCYKSTPSLYHMGADGEVTRVDLDQFVREGLVHNEYTDSAGTLVRYTAFDPECCRIEGEYQGCEFTIRLRDVNMADLELVEADGGKWTSTCGYLYGAGHMDDPERADDTRSNR